MPIADLIGLQSKAQQLAVLEVDFVDLKRHDQLVLSEGRVVEFLLFDHVTALHALEQHPHMAFLQRVAQAA